MKIGFTCSTFDLLHAGHIQMLREAKSQCDYLYVGLQTDPSISRIEKKKPVQDVSERYIQVKAVQYVDEVIPYTTEGELIELISLIQPDVRIIGEEYRDIDFTGKDYCIENYIELYYNKRQHGFSTTNLRSRLANA
jgi:glycerol-3-phosphate cytidylyltransferase